MPKRKKFSVRKERDSFAKQIEKAVAGLYYISETDAEIKFFNGGKVEDVTAKTLLKQIGKSETEPVEKRNFGEFFARLTEIQDWHGEEEKEMTRKFVVLEGLLQKKLNDLEVFKVGKIQLEIYVVGIDKENRLMGIKTEAVET